MQKQGKFLFYLHFLLNKMNIHYKVHKFFRNMKIKSRETWLLITEVKLMQVNKYNHKYIHSFIYI